MFLLAVNYFSVFCLIHAENHHRSIDDYVLDVLMNSLPIRTKKQCSSNDTASKIHHRKLTALRNHERGINEFVLREQFKKADKGQDDPTLSHARMEGDTIDTPLLTSLEFVQAFCNASYPKHFDGCLQNRSSEAYVIKFMTFIFRLHSGLMGNASEDITALDHDNMRESGKRLVETILTDSSTVTRIQYFIINYFIITATMHPDKPTASHFNNYLINLIRTTSIELWKQFYLLSKLSRETEVKLNLWKYITLSTSSSDHLLSQLKTINVHFALQLAKQMISSRTEVASLPSNCMPGKNNQSNESFALLYLERSCNKVLTYSGTGDDNIKFMYLIVNASASEVQIDISGLKITIMINFVLKANLYHQDYKYMFVYTKQDGHLSLLHRAFNQLHLFSVGLIVEQRDQQLLSNQYACNRTTDLRKPNSDSVRAVTQVDALPRVEFIGNDQSNIFNCEFNTPSLSAVLLYGGRGSDTYIISERCGSSIVINNFDERRDVDRIVLDGLSFDQLTVSVAKRNSTLIVTPTFDIFIRNYFVSDEYAHLEIVTSDKIISRVTSKPPYKEIVLQIVLGLGQPHHDASPMKATILTTAMSSFVVHGVYHVDDLIVTIGDQFLLNETMYETTRVHMMTTPEMTEFRAEKVGRIIYDVVPAYNVLVGSVHDGVSYSSMSSGVNVNLAYQMAFVSDNDLLIDAPINVNTVLGSIQSDTIGDSDGDNMIFAFNGNDSIASTGGIDLIDCGYGTKAISFGEVSAFKFISCDHANVTISLKQYTKKAMETCYFRQHNNLYVSMENSAKTTAALVFILHSSNANYTFELKDSRVFFKELFDHAVTIDISHFNVTLNVITVDRTCITLDVSMRNTQTQYDFELHYTNEGDTEHTKSNLPRAQKTVRLCSLHSGVSYSFVVVTLKCGIHLTLSNIIVQRTVPSPPHNLNARIINNTHAFIEWDNADMEVDQYQYNVVLFDGTYRRSYMTCQGVQLFSFSHDVSVRQMEYELQTKIDSLQSVPTSTYTLILKGEVSDLCGTVPLADNTEVVETYVDEETNAKIGFRCVDGYATNNSVTYLCSEFDPADLRCEPVYCYFTEIHLSTLRFQRSFNGVAYDQRFVTEGINITASCKPGTKPNRAGRAIQHSRCTQGVWMPPLEACVLDDECSFASLPQRSTGLWSISYGELTYATLGCFHNTVLMNNVSVKCITEHGIIKWQTLETYPHCEAIYCVARVGEQCSEAIDDIFGIKYCSKGTEACYDGYWHASRWFNAGACIKTNA